MYLVAPDSFCLFLRVLVFMYVYMYVCMDAFLHVCM